MCFSATASLVAGSALSATGIATISLARSKKELPLASMPLIFGVHQLIDGAVWLTFGIEPIHSLAIQGYAFFELVLWPVFVPFAVLLVETNQARRNILEALSLVGFGVGLFFLYFIIAGHTTAQVVNHCVAYDTPHPYPLGVLAFYLIATGGSFLVSSKPILQAFGVVILVSFSIAGWFYVEAFTSVWCFFAAVLSVLVYWYFRSRQKKPRRS
jgi:hypothetical protein